MRRVAVVGIGDPTRPPFTSLVEGLQALGYVEGKNLELMRPVASDDPDGMARMRLATAAVQRKAEVIFAWGSTAANAVKKVTTTIPIVIQTGNDPVEAGLVRNLSRPEGNITGIASGSAYLVEKRVEVLKEFVPGLRKLGVVSDPAAGSREQARKYLNQAAKRLKLGVHIVEVPDLTRLREANASLASAKADALFPMPSNRFLEYRNELVQMAAVLQLPAVYFAPAFVRAGGLLSYSVDTDAMFHRIALFVDRLLKGAKVSDLPFEQPAKFVLALNLRTAKSQGIAVPPALLVRADEVIQ
jgi:putative tryptophan/tyrosine transport system substrate-binding protein